MIIFVDWSLGRVWWTSFLSHSGKGNSTIVFCSIMLDKEVNLMRVTCTHLLIHWWFLMVLMTWFPRSTMFSLATMESVRHLCHYLCYPALLQVLTFPDTEVGAMQSFAKKDHMESLVVDDKQDLMMGCAWTTPPAQ
jgi:hypothetical protein